MPELIRSVADKSATAAAGTVSASQVGIKRPRPTAGSVTCSHRVVSLARPDANIDAADVTLARALTHGVRSGLALDGNDDLRDLLVGLHSQVKVLLASSHPLSRPAAQTAEPLRPRRRHQIRCTSALVGKTTLKLQTTSGESRSWRAFPNSLFAFRSHPTPAPSPHFAAPERKG
jgi:hypothetical protein